MPQVIVSALEEGFTAPAGLSQNQKPAGGQKSR